jgi:hypothetical protein
VDKLMDKYDLTHDHKLNFDEFCNMMKHVIDLHGSDEK